MLLQLNIESDRFRILKLAGLDIYLGGEDFRYKQGIDTIFIDKK